VSRRRSANADLPLGTGALAPSRRANTAMHTPTSQANQNSQIKGTGRDMTPQQDPLSGVIICPAYRRTAVRANSFATGL
jgi:hypothetical protein